MTLALPLHFGITGALAYALEVGLDDAFEVLLEAAGAGDEGILLDVALELLLAALVTGALHDGVTTLGPAGAGGGVVVIIVVVVVVAAGGALELLRQLWCP